MNERWSIGLVRFGVVLGGVLAVAASVVILAIVGVGDWWLAFGGFITLLSLSFGGFAWFGIAGQPRNRVVWIMAAVALGGGLWLTGLAVALLLQGDDPARIANVISSGTVPSELGTAAAIVRGVTEATAIPPLIALFTFGLLLLPDGRLPSGRRWRWFAGIAGAGVALTAVGGLWAFRPWSEAPTSDDIVYGLATVVSAVASILALVGLVTRFRQSTGAERDQFKWVVWGAGIFTPTIVVSMIIGGTSYEPLAIAVITVGALAFVTGIGIAAGRYKLFDVDVVIRRTAIVAGLAVLITLVYAVLVGAVGLIVGFQTEATLPLSIAATVVVAVVFQPLRERMRRWADRLVYGERTSPYEVLSRFSTQMKDAVAPHDVMPYLAELLASGTGAREAIVWLVDDDEFRSAAMWPDGESAAAAAVPLDDSSIPGADHMALVEHDGELLGAVSVTMPPNEEMSAGAQRLVDDIASQAGLVVRNARLIQELRSSRQRLVAAQDEERRRLERDLHDGAQQQFVAVKMKAAVAQRLVANGDAERASEVLGEVLADVDAGVEALRDLAHGIYPPLLEAEGLPAALKARARKAPLAVSVQADLPGRYPQEVEAAIYFCVLEAIQNAAKYSHAQDVSVTLRAVNGTLEFQVADDGAGFDPGVRSRGRGLTNMSDRIDALGGTLTVESSPGAGTKVTGEVHVVRQRLP